MAATRAPGGGRKAKASTLAERLRDDLPLVEDRVLPDPPEHLDDMARQEWQRTGTTLLNAGLMAEMFTTALAAYCVAYSRWVDAERRIQRHGPVIKTPQGFFVQSPFLQIANKALEQMKGMLTEFGMTPASQYRLPKRVEGEKPKRETPKRDSKDPRIGLGELRAVK